VPEVVRVTVNDPSRLAGAPHGVLQAADREAHEDTTIRRAILTRASIRNLGHQPGGHSNPSAGRCRLPGLHPEVVAVLVDVGPGERVGSPTRIPVCSSTRSGSRHRFGTVQMIVSTS
jgi:hypothetical protein